MYESHCQARCAGSPPLWLTSLGVELLLDDLGVFKRRFFVLGHVEEDEERQTLLSQLLCVGKRYLPHLRSVETRLHGSNAQEAA